VPDRFRLEQLRRRVAVNPASIAFAALAEEYRRAGMLDEAIATCEAGLRRHPSYLSARVTLGMALIDAGRHDAAQHELEEVLRLAPGNLAAMRGLGMIQDEKRRRENPPPVIRPEDRQIEALDGFLAAIHEVRSASWHPR
jgi:Flp pilus assembly protein TadD